MISCFPDFYPDELIYSVLARYYIQSGYMAYICVAEDLFQRKTVRPDIEFLNEYTENAIYIITKNLSIETIIYNHTMFSYYGRFLPKERRNNAFHALLTMQGNYNNLLAIPKNKDGKNRYLRYCPVCAKEDREQYGETYWHRLHQMQGINICPLHKCKLIDSAVIISGKSSPDLVSAETSVPTNSNTKKCENEIECRLAEYAMHIFHSDMDLQSDVCTGDYLYHSMSGTNYLSVRGKQRNISLFHADFSQYYRSLVDNRFTELWQIQKVLTNDRVNFYEICMIALFLNIPAADLVEMRLPEKSQKQLFDEAIFKLHEEGIKYPEIARRLNAPYDTVKSIGEKRYGIYHKEPKKPIKCGAKAMNWKQIDEDTLPVVKETIAQIMGNGNTRPKKVTVFAVENLLNLPSKRIEKLPLCKAEILKNYENQAEYWAREVTWAIQTIIDEGKQLNWKQVRNLTNMRKQNLVMCLPYLHEFKDIVEQEFLNGSVRYKQS